MTRVALDLRGKTMTELMAMRHQVEMDLLFVKFVTDPSFIRLLEERHKIRDEIERRHGDMSVTGEIVWEPGEAQAKVLKLIDEGKL